MAPHSALLRNNLVGLFLLQQVDHSSFVVIHKLARIKIACFRFDDVLGKLEHLLFGELRDAAKTIDLTHAEEFRPKLPATMPVLPREKLFKR